MTAIRNVLLFVLFVASTPSASADDTRSMLVDAKRVAADVEHMVTCAECGTDAIERVERYRNAAVDSLAKAYSGDASFLRIPERQRAFAAAYKRFSPYLAVPVNEAEYVDGETGKVLRLAHARAKVTLERIGTPEAIAVLKRGAETSRTSQ